VKVTAVTTWFPTEVAPSRGAFVVRDVAAISAHADVRVVHLVPPQDDDGTRRLVHEGIEVLRIPMSPKDPRSVAAAARALPDALAGADVVHTMAFSSLLPFAPRRPRAPWVHTEHWSALTTPATLPAPARAALPVLTRLLARPDRVTAVCDFLAVPIRAVRRDRPTDIVPCIVDPHPLVPRRARDDGRLLLVSTGGLIDRKDPLVAVETVAELARRGVDVHLTWLGEGPLREVVEARVRELGLTDRVALPGSRSGAQVREALGAADLFFGPTRADNFFVSAAEALVAGRPVVLGSTGGQGEYTRDEVGALVDAQDPVAYADAVLRVDARTRDLSSEEIAGTIGSAFSTPVVGAGYRDTYAAAIRDSDRRRGPAASPSRPESFPAEAAAAGSLAERRPVTVVIACHTTDRPLGRAVASVLDGSGDVAEVLVVCHNIGADELRAEVRPEHRDRVDFRELHDGIRSPAGPFNAGLAAAETEFVAIMGSDDTLESGAVASWLALQHRTGADFVISRLALGGARTPVPTPAVRPLPGRHGVRDLVKDRLSYRSAPLGLMRRSTVEDLGLEMVAGLGVGEDVAFMTRLVAEAATAYDANGPAYVIGEDAGDRVTYVIRPLGEQIGFLAPILEADWFRRLPSPARSAVVVKFLRIHVFGAVHYRPLAEHWTAAERDRLCVETGALLAAAPGAERVLSLAERDLLDACLDPAVPDADLVARSATRRRHGRPRTLLVRDPRFLLAREAPLRFMAASALVTARGLLARR
jgi:glycosyltransferase involved in cell wall biosynthesis